MALREPLDLVHPAALLQLRELTLLESWLLVWTPTRVVARAPAVLVVDGQAAVLLVELPQLLRNLRGCWSLRLTERRPNPRLRLLLPHRQARRLVAPVGPVEVVLLVVVAAARQAVAVVVLAELLEAPRQLHFRSSDRRVRVRL